MDHNNTVINYKCPNCAAPLKYAIDTQRWDCHFCNSTFGRSQIEQIEAQEGSAEQQPVWESLPFEEGETVVYTCPSCGGRVLADNNTSATFCPYCHNPTIIAAKLSGEYQPARLIPFKLTKEDAQKALEKLCGKKPLLPKAFRDAANRGEITGLYVPFWLYGAEYDATLNCTGHIITRWSDASYNYVKTDSYRVSRRALLPFDKVPVDGSSRLDDKLMDALEPFHYSQMESFSMQYLSGYLAETYDVDAAKCRVRFEERAKKAVDVSMRGYVSGYHNTIGTNISYTSKKHEVLYVLLPVWMLRMPHGGRTYTFAMNGQTGKIVGKLPVSWQRALAWFAGLTGVMSLVSFLVMLGGVFFL